MALNDAHVGARHTGQTITWTRNDGTAENLTGATVTGKMKKLDTGAVKSITGTLTVTTPASGIFTWAYATADIDTAGVYEVQFKATFADTTYDLSFVTTMHVREAVT